MLNRFVGSENVMAAIHYQLISVTILRFFEALQSAHRNMSTRIGMFFCRIRFIKSEESIFKS